MTAAHVTDDELWQKWWEDVRALIESPAWAANLIQTVAGSLVGTAIALVGAGIVLVRQLRHDRELAAQTAADNQESWLADRRAFAVNEVGTLLLEAAQELKFDDESEWVDRLRQTKPPADSIYAIVNSSRIPGLEKVKRARGLANLRLSLDGTISALQTETAGRWYVSLQLLDDPALVRLSPEQVTTVVHRISNYSMASCRAPLEKLGEALCRWDGRGQPPGRVNLGEWTPSGGGTVPPKEPHLSKLLEEERDGLAKLIEALRY